MSFRYYDRDSKEITEWEFHALSGQQKYKIIKQDKIGEFLVSTIWLGMDYSFQSDEILIFETMIFDQSENTNEWMDIYSERYSTEEQALDGHLKAIEVAKEGNFE